MNNWTRLAVSLLPAALFLSACSGGNVPEAGSEDLRELNVVVANPSAVAYYPIYVAEAQGFFEEEGLTVNVEALDGSSPGLQALSSGQADIISPAAGPLLKARERGEDPVFFYNLTPRNIFSLVVPADSGITDPAELDGTTVGLGTVDGAEKGLVRTVLSESDLTESENYEFLTVGDGGLATAGFERGEIDAYAASIADVAIINARGIETTNITPETYQGMFSNGLAATGSFIAENPDVVEGFSRAVTRAIAWGRDNKDDALETAAEVSPEEASDPELASALFDVVVEFGTPIGDNPLGYSPPEAWERWHEDVLNNGDLEEPIADLESAYTNEFVDAANEEIK